MILSLGCDMFNVLIVKVRICFSLYLKEECGYGYFFVFWLLWIVCSSRDLFMFCYLGLLE